MARRRRRYEEEEELELEEVLEPYQGAAWEEQEQPADPQELYMEDYQQYDDGYMEEYSEEHEDADHESHFRIAMGFFDLISILVGIAVVLLLVAMLVTLFSWLRNDILHSALFMQSGLQ